MSESMHSAAAFVPPASCQHPWPPNAQPRPHVDGREGICLARNSPVKPSAIVDRGLGGAGQTSVCAAFADRIGGACCAVWKARPPRSGYFSSSVTLEAGAGGAATVTGLTSDL